MGKTYKRAGVDIVAGEKSAKAIAALVRRTFSPHVFGGVGGFGALFRLPKGIKDPVLVSGADGVGTKVKIANALGRHDTVGIDLVAMNVDDVVCSGARPLFFLDYIGIHKVKPLLMKSLIRGMVKGCEEAGCALIGGETAEMPDLYRRGEYDLAGFAVGVVERKKMIEPHHVRPGDFIAGLGSSGLHSNGYTLARKILPKSFYREMLTPTRIYAPFILETLARFDIHGICHVTGGGIPGNLPRILPKNLGAEIYEGSWPVHPIFGEIEDRGKVSRKEMYRTFNMGIGMILILPGEQVPSFMQFSRQKKMDAYWLGKVDKMIRGVRIT